MRPQYLLILFIIVVMLVSANCKGVEVTEPDAKWRIMTSHLYHNKLQLRLITTKPVQLYCVATTERGWYVTDTYVNVKSHIKKVNMFTDYSQYIKSVECHELQETS